MAEALVSTFSMADSSVIEAAIPAAGRDMLCQHSIMFCIALIHWPVEGVGRGVCRIHVVHAPQRLDRNRIDFNQHSDALMASA